MNHLSTGTYLVRRIKESGLSQRQISRGTGIAQTTIGRLMDNEGNTTVATYDAIINYLDSLPRLGKDGR